MTATQLPGAARRIDDRDVAVIERLADLPRDVGWLLIYLGVLGLVVPGVIGFPFLIAGGAVLTPGGPAR